MLPPRPIADRTPLSAAPLSVHLLGVVDFEACLALQQRLVYESSGRRDGHITLLVCEHPTLITIGRHGSRADIRIDARELASRDIPVRWVNRGGGTLVHAPGQLAVYPIVPLDQRGYTVGEFLDRLQRGVMSALTESGFAGQTHAGRHGVWGRVGQVAAVGAAVKSWVSYFGAYINVCPEMQLFRRVDSEPRESLHGAATQHASMSSLVVERQQPVRMAGVREMLLRNLAAAFDCERYHLFTGHPLLPRATQPPREASARVG